MRAGPTGRGGGHQEKQNDDSAGLAVAAYLRDFGLGFEPRSVLYQRQVAVLATINTDPARLGKLPYSSS